MTRPNYVQVEGWRVMLCGWLSFGAIWLRTLVLECAGMHQPEFWTFTAAVELPFGEEDAGYLRSLLQGPHRAHYLARMSARLSQWETRSTQLPETW